MLKNLSRSTGSNTRKEITERVAQKYCEASCHYWCGGVYDPNTSFFNGYDRLVP